VRTYLTFFLLALDLLAARSVLASACVPGGEAPATQRSQQSVLDHYRFDPILKNSWAIVVNCRHPEWPAALVEERNGDLGAAPNPQVEGQTWVRAGSTVRLWSGTSSHAASDRSARIELSGVAVESAPLGAAVRVRTKEGGVVLRGIVRGVNSVELLDDARGWREP
jgi:hypothetical protein